MVGPGLAALSAWGSRGSGRANPISAAAAGRDASCGDGAAEFCPVGTTGGAGDAEAVSSEDAADNEVADGNDDEAEQDGEGVDTEDVDTEVEGVDMGVEGVDVDPAIDLGLDAGVGDVDVRGGIEVVGEGGREGLDVDGDGDRDDRSCRDSSAEAGAPATDDRAPRAPSAAAEAELGRLAAAAEANDSGPWSGVIFNRASRRLRPRSSASSALLASPRQLPSH